MTLFNLRAFVSDTEHEFFEMSLRLNGVKKIEERIEKLDLQVD